MTSPFPFVAGAILDAADLNAIGAWTAFTPSWNSVTGGASGTSSGAYAQVNDIVFWQAQFDLNGTGSISGHINMDLPVGTCALSIAYPTAVSGWAQPTGSSIYTICGFTATAQVYFYANVVSGTYGQITAATATAPETWDANGMFFVNGWYELA